LLVISAGCVNWFLNKFANDDKILEEVSESDELEDESVEDESVESEELEEPEDDEPEDEPEEPEELERYLPNKL
jgi:hypothetical protein